MSAEDKIFPKTRMPGNLVFSVLFVSITLALAVALPSQAPFLDGTKLVAQPGFWPMIAVGMMVVFGGIHLVGILRTNRAPGRGAEVWLWLRSFEYVAWFIAYVYVIPVIGYLPSSVLFMPLLCFRLGYRKPAILAYAALFGAAVVVVFKTALGVPMPAGQIYEYLPDGLRNFFLVNF